MLTRRQLLKRGAFGGAGLLVARAPFATAAPAAVGATPKLRKWVEPLAGAAGARRPGRGQELHDRGEGVDELEVPPEPAGDEDLGLLVRQPRGGLALPGTDDRGDAPAQRHGRDVRDGRVAQRARDGVPAQRPDARWGPSCREIRSRSSRTCTAARTIRSSTARRCSGSPRPAPRARTTSPTGSPTTTSSARRWSGITTTRSATRARTSTRGSRGRTSSATTRTRASPAIRSACPPARTRSRSCCRTRRSTPTGACSTRRRA